MIWVLKGIGRETAERCDEAQRCMEPNSPGIMVAEGLNTYEEAVYIATHCSHPPLRIVTSAYHVPRAYLTIRAALRVQGLDTLVQVWGEGTVTNEQAQREAAKLVEAQAKGHALKWEDV